MTNPFLLLLMVYLGILLTSGHATRSVRKQVKLSPLSVIAVRPQSRHALAPKLRQKVVHPGTSLYRSTLKRRAALLTKPGATVTGVQRVSTHATSIVPPYQGGPSLMSTRTIRTSTLTTFTQTPETSTTAGPSGGTATSAPTSFPTSSSASSSTGTPTGATSTGTIGSTSTATSATTNPATTSSTGAITTSTSSATTSSSATAPTTSTSASTSSTTTGTTTSDCPCTYVKYSRCYTGFPPCSGGCCPAGLTCLPSSGSPSCSASYTNCCL